MLKRQSPTTVLLRTTLAWMITLNKLWILLGSNHLPYINLSQSVFFVQSFEASIKYSKSKQRRQVPLALPSPFNCYMKSLLTGYSGSSVGSFTKNSSSCPFSAKGSLFDESNHLALDSEICKYVLGTERDKGDRFLRSNSPHMHRFPHWA